MFRRIANASKMYGTEKKEERERGIKIRQKLFSPRN
jgi:hypothetical protein